MRERQAAMKIRVRGDSFAIAEACFGGRGNDGKRHRHEVSDDTYVANNESFRSRTNDLHLKYAASTWQPQGACNS